MSRVASTGEVASVDQVHQTVATFVDWLDAYGETSYDHQSMFAGRVGGPAKALYYRHPALGTVAVAPMLAFEAFLPVMRQAFWKRQRFPIADAHYASGFAFLAKASQQESHYLRAVHFLQALIASRADHCRYAWGYPFDWVTVRGTIKSGTPLITTVPYVYEAFEQVYRIDSDGQWLAIMKSIADHALLDYTEHSTSKDAASCSYTPNPADTSGVVNASAYRAWLLTKAGYDFDDAGYRDAGQRSLNFVLQSQNEDGSWYYAMDQKRDFIDHFHTCFVLKALVKTFALTGQTTCSRAIERGVEYYLGHLFDEQGLPKPFSRRPRLTIYRRELYDYAECINLGVLLSGRVPDFDARLRAVVGDLLRRWKKGDGSFRARQLMFGWDNVPMHRWAQAQIFRSLTFLIHQNAIA